MAVTPYQEKKTQPHSFTQLHAKPSSKHSLSSEDKYTTATSQLLNGAEVEMYSIPETSQGRLYVKGFLTSTRYGITGMHKLERSNQPAYSIQCNSYQRRLLIFKKTKIGQITLSLTSLLVFKYISYN